MTRGGTVTWVLGLLKATSRKTRIARSASASLGEKARLTIKGRSEGITRAEFEYAWVGAEVPADVRYFNSCLAVLPYAKW